MRTKRQGRIAILSRGLIIFGVLAASRGAPIFAQARLDDADVRARAPVLSTTTTAYFAVIGDYGYGYYSGTNEAAVAAMVTGWNPDFIITTGDNNYPSGSATSIDPNIGQYYSNYIYPYAGIFSPTVTITQNLFFPSLGNHDWYTYTVATMPYLNYFTLPGNERYYDFVRGPVHFFAVDSDSHEPDGITKTSKQAVWLERQLAHSTSPWRLVYFHHPPYTSGTGHSSTTELQWPYQAWGATAVLAGHVHNYERILKNNFPYFVNGLGGRSVSPSGSPISGSVFRFDSNYGAMLVTANDSYIRFDFHSITDTVTALDSYTVTTPSTSNRAYIPAINR